MIAAAFAVLLALAALGAVLRGGVVEQRGVGLLAAAWLTSLAAQHVFGEGPLPLWFLGIDLGVLAGLIALTWKSPRPWPIYACGLQALTVTADLVAVLSPTLDARLYLTFVAALGFGVVAVMTLGAWLPPRGR